MNINFALKAISFFLNLEKPQNLSGGISVLHPYEDEEVKFLVRSFFNKFYSDSNKRIFVLGINPGRFGGGKTGISFTDPVALRKYCGIENSLGSKRELSSKFVYSVINKFGGASEFFSNFFLSAVYPFALIKEGKNYNYYDSKALFISLKEELIASLKQQIFFGAKKDVVISLGKKNAEFLIKLNSEAKLFDKVVYLEHPRYIMQYRSKKLDEYIGKYLSVLESCLK